VCSLQGSSVPHSQQYLTINNHAALLATKQFAPAMVTVPNVLGLQQAEAVTAMKSTGLIQGPISLDNRCIDWTGTVLAQNPSAGPRFTSPGETFELTVSSGVDKNGKPCRFQ
jgi:beta-lactam-binding protein with PASTA domain